MDAVWKGRIAAQSPLALHTTNWPRTGTPKHLPSPPADQQAQSRNSNATELLRFEDDRGFSGFEFEFPDELAQLIAGGTTETRDVTTIGRCIVLRGRNLNL